MVTAAHPAEGETRARAFAPESHRSLLDGAVHAGAGAPIAVVNPATEEQVLRRLANLLRGWPTKTITGNQKERA